jgi:5-dehydro-4-deoxyglucarate dehydratase
MLHGDGVIALQTDMEPLELRDKSRGVIAFPVTPFQPDLSLDLNGLRQNLMKLIEHPISALVIAGGTGELYSLTPEEHVEVVRTSVHAVAGRVPIIVGVGFGQTLATELARSAAANGADGILVFPPYYPQADDEGMFEYYRAIAAATPLGMLIYSRDWANFSQSFVARLTSLSTLIAWKDGQGDIRKLQAIINRVGDRLLWIGGAGDDLVAAYYSTGIRTFTSSIASVAPRLSLRLHELASEKREAELNELLHRCVIPLYAIRARRKGYEVSTMKAMMDMAGLAGGPVRPPLVNVTAAERDELQTILTKWKEFM